MLVRSLDPPERFDPSPRSSNLIMDNFALTHGQKSRAIDDQKQEAGYSRSQYDRRMATTKHLRSSAWKVAPGLMRELLAPGIKEICDQVKIPQPENQNKPDSTRDGQ